MHESFDEFEILCFFKANGVSSWMHAPASGDVVRQDRTWAFVVLQLRHRSRQPEVRDLHLALAVQKKVAGLWYVEGGSERKGLSRQHVPRGAEETSRMNIRGRSETSRNNQEHRRLALLAPWVCLG